MVRPLTRNQQLENRAFVKALRRTGNIRLAAREVGIHYGTVQHRRGAHPNFAHAIDAALAFAAARLTERRPPEGADGDHRTRGGEPVVVRSRDGRLQLRAAQPGKLTRDCEQAFLAALSATANVRLSAAAAGASVAAFYRRRRQNPGFAREMKLALQMGYDRLEEALLAGFEPDAYEDDAWRHNEPPAVPPMTANQALQLLYLHQKEARLTAEPPRARRRRGEPEAAYHMRLVLMSEARREAEQEMGRLAEAERLAAGGAPSPYAPGPPRLPDLAQVTGWSDAKPDAGGVHDPDVALFGGWRLRQMRERDPD